MPAVVLYTLERHAAVPPLGSNSPTAAAIAAALRGSTGGGQWGNFIGPYPRITRYLTAASGVAGVLPGTADYVTRVSWLYGWPDTQYTRDNLALLYRNLQQAANQKLQEVSSGFGPITLLEYNPALMGTIAWWNAPNGAQMTTTRDQFPSLFAVITENPIGPAPVVGAAEGLWEKAKPFVYAGLVLGGLYAVAPYVMPLVAAARRNGDES